MNCTELYQDIATLTAERDKLSADFARANETMKGVIALKELSTKIDQLENQILEKYLANFAEKNPNVCTWELGEQIDVPECECVNAIAQLADGGVFIGGHNGALYEFRPNENGEWKLGEKVDTGRDNIITTIAQLPNGDILIGGENSTLCRCQLDENGEWKLNENIKGLKKKYERVSTMTQLPNHNILIGGEGVVYEYGPDESGEWQLTNKIEGIKDNVGEENLITAIANLPDGGILIGGVKKHYTNVGRAKTANGDWGMR